MKLIFITFLILYFVGAPAQHLPNHLIYLSGDLAFGNYFGVGLNLNYVLKNSYSASVAYNTGIKRPGNLPRDLRAGLFGIKP